MYRVTLSSVCWVCRLGNCSNSGSGTTVPHSSSGTTAPDPGVGKAGPESGAEVAVPGVTLLNYDHHCFDQHFPFFLAHTAGRLSTSGRQLLLLFFMPEGRYCDLAPPGHCDLDDLAPHGHPSNLMTLLHMGIPPLNDPAPHGHPSP